MANGFSEEQLQALDTLIQSSVVPGTTSDTYRDPSSQYLFPDLVSEAADDTEWGSLWDMFGSAAWHFGSSATLGGLELFAPTKSWEDKNTAERIGAAIGEATGMFVPMSWIGKGIRGGVALTKGSRATVRGLSSIASKNAVSQIADATAKKTLEKTIHQSLKKGAYKDVKDILYRHEFGGEVLENVNRTLKINVEAALRGGIKQAGLKLDDKVVKETVEFVAKGLRDPSKHVNSISSWVEKGMKGRFGDGRIADWFSRYTGDVFQDMAVLGTHGLLHNRVMSWAKEDMEFAPGTALKHSAMMSLTFPFIRYWGGGGERRMGEFWNILKREHKKTNYDKLLQTATGPEDVQGLLKIITGGKYRNILKNTKWTAASGRHYGVAEISALDFRNPTIAKDGVDILKQMQNSIGKFDQVKLWGYEWGKDFVTPGSALRMTMGAMAMNTDMFRDNAAMLRNLPPEEVLTHFLIGALMTKGKGGWLRDPARRKSDYKANELHDHYSLMSLFGIEHSNVSNYLSVKSIVDANIVNNIGLIKDPTAQKVYDVYKKYNKIIEGRTEDLSSTKVDDIVEEWKPLSYTMEAQIEGTENLKGHNYKKLSPEERISMETELGGIVHKEKSLDQIKYQEFIHTFNMDASKGSAKLYKDFLLSLGRDSSEGADDKVLNIYEDAKGLLRYGGIEWESLDLNNSKLSSGNVAQLDNLMSELTKRGLAKREDGKGYEIIDLGANAKAVERLMRKVVQFQEILKTNGLGEKVNWEFDIDNNPFLNQWLTARQIEGEKRIGDIVIGKDVKEMDSKDLQFRQSVKDALKDKDGFIYDPKTYRITEDTGNKEVDYNTDPDLFEKFYGISSAFYHGGRKTKRITDDGKPINIKLSDVKTIIGSYEKLNFGISPESLFNEKYTRMLQNRTYENFGLRPESIRVIKALEESNLVQKDEINSLFHFNSTEAIEDMANAAGLDANEYKRYHNEIISSLGGDSKYIQRSKTKIEFPFESGREPNLEGLKRIHKLIPQVYEKEIATNITEALQKGSVTFDSEKALFDLDTITSSMRKRNYTDAMVGLENLKNHISKDVYEGVKKVIIDAQAGAQVVDMTVKELADGRGTVHSAIQNMIAAEKSASRYIENLLTDLVYKGSQQSFRAVNDYINIVDNLSSALKGTVGKAKITALFENYLQNNSYKDLHILLSALDKKYAGISTPNDIDNSHMLDAYDRVVHNMSSNRQKDKISIGSEYGLVDPVEGKLIPLVVEKLNAGGKALTELKEFIKRQNPDLFDKIVEGQSLDENLAYLSWIVKNTSEYKKVELTEMLTQDGETILVRRWVHPMDNSEFKTPSHGIVDRFNKAGIEVYFVSKTGIINRRVENNISIVDDIGKLFNSVGFDFPDRKYLSGVIKKGGQIDPKDELLRSLNVPKGAMKFVEVSLGRPLVFVENQKSIDALNNSYKTWYDDNVTRLDNQGKMGLVDKTTVDNFKVVFDPNGVKSNEVKIRAMYLSELNTGAFDKLWSSKDIQMFNGPEGHYGDAIKLLKYTKLAEGGSLKMIPDIQELQDMLDHLPKIASDRKESIERIISDLGVNNMKLGLYADESGGTNPLLIRNRQIFETERVQNSELKQHLRDRYSDAERFKAVLDKSSIDGAIYIDKDVRNLFLTLLSEGSHINGFKGSMASGGTSAEYILFGKGLFIFDPKIASGMDGKVRFLAGESAIKNLRGLAVDNFPVKGRVAESLDLATDVQMLTDNNMMKIDFNGIGLRFGGHLSNNAPVPHPWTHYQSKENVLNIRDGWMMLDKNIQELNHISQQLRDASVIELANAISDWQRQTGSIYETTFPDFASQMLEIGFSTRNPVIREAVVRMWEDKALPMLLRPRNSKFSNPFVVPDAKSEAPLSVDLWAKDRSSGYATGDVKGGVRIQLGESTLGADARHMPVGSINELVFSMRSGDVDWLIKYDKATGEFETYTPLQEYSKAGYAVDVGISHIEKSVGKPPIIPKEITKFFRLLDNILSGKSSIKLDDPAINAPSLDRIQRFLEEGMIGKKPKFAKLNDYNFRLVVLNERGPRKSVSDFVPTRLRLRSPDELRDINGIGTTYKMNPFDIAANFQADHDGDKVRFTHDFSKNFSHLKQSYKTSSINEEYKVYDAGVRPANLFGTGVDKTLKLQPAGTFAADNIGLTKKTMISDQRAVGKVIGAQSALEWMYLTDFSIDIGDGGGLQLISDKMGFEANNLMENGNIFRRFDKINQSIVDFTKKIDPELVKRPIENLLYGDIEQEYTGRVFDYGPKNDIGRDVVAEVINVLKAPAAIFNQVWSEQGGKNPTAYDIESHYTRILKFFNDPNGYILNRLVYKYSKDRNINLADKLNSIVPIFFKTEGDVNIIPRDMADLKSKLLRGEIRPNKNVIQFDKSLGIDELINKSNIGYMMSEIVGKEMFKAKEMDLAWEHMKENTKKGKFLTEQFIDEIQMLRVLGVTNQEMINNGDTAFQFGKNRWIQNAEKASMIYDLLSHEMNFLSNKLEYQLGFKQPNKKGVTDVIDRMENVQHAQEVIVNLRTKQILEKVGESQIKRQVRSFKNGKKYFNGNKRNKAVYEVSGPLYTDGKPIWDNLKFFGTILPGHSIYLRKGRYVILDNPVVGHRLSRESAMEGYVWNYTTNTVPEFVNPALFRNHMDRAKELTGSLTKMWNKTVYEFRGNKALGSDYFSNAANQKRLMLDMYFKQSNREINPDAVLDQFGFDAQESSMYYLAKLLLKPSPLSRQYIKGDNEMAFLKLNDRIVKDVFQYLYDTGNKHIATQIITEYNSIKDYMSGFSNEMTFKLKPSSLFLNKYSIDKSAVDEPLSHILSGIITPDTEILLRNNFKIGLTSGDIKYRQEGEFNLREIRNGFSEWVEKDLDSRIPGCGR